MSGGKLSPNTKLLNNPYGYNGEYHDLESGFQYLRARYYNPETARFITRDSYVGDINEPFSLNRYAYTVNNPVKYKDPSGNWEAYAGDYENTHKPPTSTSSSSYTKAATNNQPTLKKGSTDSNSVSKLQNMLRTIGYDIDVDGKFGEQTKKAVMDFQAKAKIGVDGVVGNQTWSSINTVYRNVESTGIPAGKITIPKGSSKSNSNSNSYIGSKMDLQLSYNKKGCDGEERIKSGSSFLKETGSMTASFIPILGDVKDIQETITGEDLITGEKLTKGQRILTGVMIVLPVANGKAARETVEKIVDSPIGDGIKKGSQKVVERIEKALDEGFCFTGETLIAIRYGYKSIKDIEVGDEVYSENPETGEKGLKKVKNKYVNETKELIYISIGQTKIKATPSHPFWIIGKGWTPAEEVKVGDKVKLSSGEEAEVTKVEKEALKEPIKVYNFEVEDWHTYYVSDKNVLVHNKCTADPKEAGKGPYSHLDDPASVGTGKDFTAVQKKNIIEENMKRNGGVVKSDLSGQELVKPSKSQKGVTPPENEWQIDHINAKDNGGSNSYSNAQVLSRKENRLKSNK